MYDSRRLELETGIKGIFGNFSALGTSLDWLLLNPVPSWTPKTNVLLFTNQLQTYRKFWSGNALLNIVNLSSPSSQKKKKTFRKDWQFEGVLKVSASLCRRTAGPTSLHARDRKPKCLAKRVTGPDPLLYRRLERSTNLYGRTVGPAIQWRSVGELVRRYEKELQGKGVGAEKVHGQLVCTEDMISQRLRTEPMLNQRIPTEKLLSQNVRAEELMAQWFSTEELASRYYKEPQMHWTILEFSSRAP